MWLCCNLSVGHTCRCRHSEWHMPGITAMMTRCLHCAMCQVPPLRAGTQRLCGWQTRVPRQCQGSSSSTHLAFCWPLSQRCRCNQDACAATSPPTPLPLLMSPATNSLPAAALGGGRQCSTTRHHSSACHLPRSLQSPTHFSHGPYQQVQSTRAVTSTHTTLAQLPLSNLVTTAMAVSPGDSYPPHIASLCETVCLSSGAMQPATEGGCHNAGQLPP
jgi:hypothetical protein